jgi:hypothetical protein
MSEEYIIERVLQASEERHPTYTKEQHLSYAVGFLASIVMEKTLMDNIIWARLKERLDYTR